MNIDLRGHERKLPRLVVAELWCPCGEYMKGDGHGQCPSCEDRLARAVKAARRFGIPESQLAYLTGQDNICRGQE